MLDLLEQIIAIAINAGHIILEHYHAGASYCLKEDNSPLSSADLAADEFIRQSIERLNTKYPIISEETYYEGFCLGQHDTFWLIDPLDGTKEFINHSDEFTVNIALIKEGKPVLGVVCAPALNKTYSALAGHGATLFNGHEKTLIQARTLSVAKPVILVSRSHGDRVQLATFLQQFPNYQLIEAGSSLKICYIAESIGDRYPRFGRTMEWDIAAAHAILLEAGGHIVTTQGEELCYGKPNLENPSFIGVGLSQDSCI